MGQNLRDIKRRIRSFQNMKQITKAMKMVAAAKLRRAQERAESARPYVEKMREVILSLAADTQEFSHPMLEIRPIRKTAYLVITSDRGSAGGYNSNLLRMFTKTLRERHQSNDEYMILVVGRKGRDYLKKRGYPVFDEVIGLADSPQFSDIKPIASQAVGFYAEEKADQLNLVFNKFVNPVIQRPVERQLLPLVSFEQEEGSNNLYEYEPSEKKVLAELLPRYAETLIYSALLEAKAGEFGARMAAMGNATDNATELIQELTLQFNRARQASITQEINEIVAGANALN